MTENDDMQLLHRAATSKVRRKTAVTDIFRNVNKFQQYHSLDSRLRSRFVGMNVTKDAFSLDIFNFGLKNSHASHERIDFDAVS